MIYAWRLAHKDHAKSVAQMLDGMGALLHGGRWNSKGTPMVYLSEHIALAALELLIHLQKEDVLTNSFCKLSVGFGEMLASHIDVDELPKNWRQPSMTPLTQEIGDKWFEDQSSLLLQVPSVVVHGASNFLLNPSHPDFASLQIGTIAPFAYDERVLK